MGINQGPISLDQKYTQGTGHIFLTGIQALVRLPMAQIRRDRAAGLNTAGFISGYRGSPLGGYDQQLFAARKHLEQYNIKFQPGVNEDLAATAIWGSQQLNLSPGAKYDGVVGIWYGKGPGVDRCGDVFRHGNTAGSAKNGGVLCLAGDDHGAKSSTVPHQSDHAFISALMPYLYPSSIHEMIEMGLLGIAMSRYSGCWVGMKVITETVETTAEIDLTDEMTPFAIPTDFEMPPGGLNLRWPDDRYEQDLRLQDYKGFAAIAFARANKINRITMDSPNARYGIMASGKSYEDIRQALRELGITEEVAAKIGLAALQDRHALAAGAGRRAQFRGRSRGDLHRRGTPRDRREPGQAGTVQLARRRAPAHRRQDGRSRQALSDLRRRAQRRLARELADRAPAST